MSFAFRASLCFLALSFNFISLALAQSQPAPSTSAAKNSDDESSLRALAEAFLGAWAARDLDGFLLLWSAQSPELEARRKETQKLFAGSERIELRGLAIRAVKMDGGQARVRLEADALVIEAGTGKEKAGYGKMMRTLHCVKEAGAWKVWREASAYDELAAALAVAKSDQEREALLAEEKDLASAELSQALHAKARRQGSYPQALAIFRLAQRVGEQVGDQPAVSNALMGIGYVYSSQGDYAKALEHFQKCVAMLESQVNKAGVSRALNNIGNVHRYQGECRSPGLHSAGKTRRSRQTDRNLLAATRRAISDFAPRRPSSTHCCSNRPRRSFGAKPISSLRRTASYGTCLFRRCWPAPIGS
jgi:tetratricopeptide (TPR) repeat protein